MNIKKQLLYFRNGLAFSFSWIVLCVVALCVLSGEEQVSISLLINLFVLCGWASVSFVSCFMNRKLQKKPFMARLSLFYVLLIPIEVVIFCHMQLFAGLTPWLIFAGIVLILYVICILLEVFVFRKEGLRYTEMLKRYNQKNN